MFTLEITLHPVENGEAVKFNDCTEGVRLDEAVKIAHKYSNSLAAFGGKATVKVVQVAGTTIH